MAEPWTTMKPEEQFAQDPMRFLREEFRDIEKERLDRNLRIGIYDGDAIVCEEMKLWKDKAFVFEGRHKFSREASRGIYEFFCGSEADEPVLVHLAPVPEGFRYILYLSRSAKEGPDTTPFFNELRSQGCSILTFAGSVNNLEDVETAVRQVTKPIAGIMQMSAVMSDNFLSQMTFSDWETCVQPKVKGTWNLHHALSASSLDFFLLFSSICGITGQWGQANYNSANSFLDAFVKYRHGQGLAASVIDIGFMGGVGMAIENAALVTNLKKSGYYFLSESDLIDALAISITHSRPGDKKSHFALGITTTKPITASSCRPAWKKAARMLEAHQFIPPLALTVEEVEKLLDDDLGNAAN